MQSAAARLGFHVGQAWGEEGRVEVKPQDEQCLEQTQQADLASPAAGQGAQGSAAHVSHPPQRSQQRPAQGLQASGIVPKQSQKRVAAPPGKQQQAQTRRRPDRRRTLEEGA